MLQKSNSDISRLYTVYTITESCKGYVNVSEPLQHGDHVGK